MNRSIIIISLFLNAILLSFLFGLIPFLLYASVGLNAFLVWYAWTLVGQNEEIQEDLAGLSDSLDSFSNHIEDIHGLEMFYGDETLRSLIDHSREVINSTIDFQEKYFDIEVVEIDETEEPAPETAPQE